MTYDEIIAQVAADNHLSKEEADSIYRSFWRAVREHISSLPLKDSLTDEEFLRLRPNVNIPSLGKFVITLDRYRTIKRIFNQRKEKQDASY